VAFGLLCVRETESLTLRDFVFFALSTKTIFPVPNFPIYSASFIGSSSNVVVTGRRPFFYIYDTVADKVQQIPKLQNRQEKSWERCVVSPHDNDTIALLGNDGYIILYNINQQKPCTTQPMKLNGSVRTVAFNQHNSNELLASGSDGDIYRYDLRYQSNYKCIERFHNDDGTITSQIATSSQTFAVGAESGVVNLYKNNTTTEPVLSQSPSLLRGLSTAPQRTPIKSIMNIKTCVDTMTYNHDGDLLAISSRFEKDCLKLVHVPTGTVYSNWPTSNTPLGYVFSIDFSPYSNYMAIGNDQGKCLLYKLTHYE
jgi:U3 small nucleolar RNA-associated protein 18